MNEVEAQTEKMLAELFEMQHLMGGKLNELRERVTKLERHMSQLEAIDRGG